MNIMPVRIGLFKVVTALYQKTGISLLKLSGQQLFPLEHGFGGEAGAFYFVPLIATFFNFSSLLAAYYFFTFLVFFAGGIASSALFYQAKTIFGKSISLLGITLLSFVVWQVGDVYVAYFFAVSFFPWFLILLEKNYYKLLVVYCFVMGVMLELAHFIRSYAALPVYVAIIVTSLLFFKNNLKKSFASLGALCMGVFIVHVYFNNVIKTRDMYLVQQQVKFTKYPLAHTFWHNIYMGFGFIDNDKDLYFSDSCSALKVISIDQNALYLTEQYEKALRTEVLRLVLKSPHYVLRVLFAKLGVLFYFLLLFANFGLLAAYWYPKPLYQELGYWIMICISALPGILTIPITTYLLGFISASALYGIYSIIYALNQRLSNLKNNCI